MIPEFDARGLLPSAGDTPYMTTLAEVEQRLVLDLGSPTWRVNLFGGLVVVHSAVAETVPSARWWLWGCFVSNHPTPLDGKDQVLSALAILPVSEIRDLGARLPMLVGFLQSAESSHRVDAPIVYEFEPGDDLNIETIEAMEGKWRPRAKVGVADHSTRVLEPAGFLEVLP